MNLLERLRARRDEINAAIRAMNSTVETEGRLTLTEDETTQYQTLSDERTQIEARIVQVEAEEERRSADATAAVANGNATRASGVTVGREPLMYERSNGRSYFQDLAKATLQNDTDAATRLQRHAQEMDVEMVRRFEARQRAADAELEQLSHVQGVRRDHRPGFFEKRVNPNRTDGQGGYFVPPLWLIDDYVPFLRAGATAANLCRNMDLPEGTDSINLPKVASGTATAVQTADAAGVQSTDLTDTFVSAGVKTIAGQQDVAMQLLDQSPVSFDEIVLQDLLADYNQKKDSQILYGSNASGQVKGIANVSGINAVTYTDATPTVPEVYLPLAQALSMIARQRTLPATQVLVTSLRWYWIMSALDSSNRPLAVPSGPGFNAVATTDGDGSEGPVGNILGVGFSADNNIATNLGAGTNQDEVFAARWSDLYLWEGAPKTRVLQEVLSGTLQVRFQLYNYLAFMADRYPVAISTINGTGLVTPSGF